MTTDELLDLIVAELAKQRTLVKAVDEAVVMLDGIRQMVAKENLFRDTVNINELVVSQTPVYQAHLTEIEDAADAIGTDPWGTQQP